MNAAARLHLILLRLSAATSIIRTRREDSERDVRHGPNGTLDERHRAAVAKIDKAVAQLEAEIA